MQTTILIQLVCCDLGNSGDRVLVVTLLVPQFRQANGIRTRLGKGRRRYLLSIHNGRLAGTPRCGLHVNVYKRGA